MAITYPLSLPGEIARATFSEVSRVGVSASPFTGQQQVQANQGKFWRVSASTPLLVYAEVAPWRAWFAKLNGPQNTFLIGDPGHTAPLGSAAGTPLVDGASQTGQTLDTKGWDSSETGVLLEGDYIQLGTGSSARIYMVMADADSDGSGLATLDIWPQLRESPSDGQTIITSNPVGLFRLAQNEAAWSWTQARQAVIEFEAVEAI